MRPRGCSPGTPGCAGSRGCPSPCCWHPPSSELICSWEKPPGFAFLAGITLTGACNLPSDKRCRIMRDSANPGALRELGGAEGPGGGTHLAGAETTGGGCGRERAGEDGGKKNPTLTSRGKGRIQYFSLRSCKDDGSISPGSSVWEGAVPEASIPRGLCCSKVGAAFGRRPRTLPGAPGPGPIPCSKLTAPRGAAGWESGGAAGELR